MPQIHIPADQNKPIIRRRFSSVPRTYRFSAQPVDPTQPLSGSVAIHGTTWLVPRAPITQPLMTSQEVTAGFWDTFLSVYVQPDTDVVVTIESGGTPATKWIMLAALLVGLLALAIAIALFMAP